MTDFNDMLRLVDTLTPEQLALLQNKINTTPSKSKKIISDAEYIKMFGFLPSRYQVGIIDWILNGTGNACCNAVAGSGKSSTLWMVAKALLTTGVKPSDVKICVFGKQNALDLIAKFGHNWKSSISTLHSAAWSLLKRELDIRDSYSVPVTGSKYRAIARSLGLIDNGMASILIRDFIVDEFGTFQKLIDLVRLCNVEATAENLRSLCNHHEIDGLRDATTAAYWINECLKIGEQQALAKTCFDFTDQLWLAVKWKLHERPWFPRVKVLLCDECQDLNPIQLELICMLAGDGRMLAVGDRCQPRDTNVLVVRKRPRGRHKIVTEEVPIQDLNIGDTVYSYSAGDGHFYASTKVAGITKRPFEGELVVVELPSGKKSKYTPNHHCIASFAPFRNQYCVYVMQKDNQFRIGMSKITIGKNRGSGPVARLKQENADALWILDFYKTKDEAYIMEQAISGKFGIPQIVFNDVFIQTKGLIEQAWKFIGDNFERAAICLNYFGRDIKYPVLKSERNWQQSLKRPMVIQASNLINGCLMLSFSNESRTYGQNWEPAIVSRENYSGDVYSLDIEKYHTYIADGIVTHNCQAIMGFAGADCDSYDAIVRRVKATNLALSICYRCPKSHIRLVKSNFPNIPIEPSENASEGVIKQIHEHEVVDFIENDDMVLSRKTAPLVGLCLKLIAQKKHATIKGRAIGDALRSEMSLIVKQPYYSWEKFNYSIDTYGAQKINTYVGHQNEEQLKENLIDKIEAVRAIYQATPAAKDMQDLASEVDVIFSDKNAPITLSVCHRAKGLEANRIFIYKPEDMPMQWKNQQDWQYQQEKNLLYVALTRAKSHLFIVGEAHWFDSSSVTTSDSPPSSSFITTSEPPTSATFSKIPEMQLELF